MTIKRKILIILLLAVVAIAMITIFVACDNTPPLVDITGVTFEDVIVDYDGKEHEITVSGQLPSGVSIEYHSNKATEAGEYIATAIMSGDGYRALILDAKLTIKALDITGVTFEDLTVVYDGNQHEINVTDSLPRGVSVSYTSNKATSAGEYTATATLTGKNYNKLTLTAKLTITKADIIGVTFEDATFDYDGSEHRIKVEGSLPRGVHVSYTSNKATAVGEYAATATLTGEGYNTLTLTAKLTIKAINFTGITFEDLTVVYDGKEHEIKVKGALPVGVNVIYSANKATAIGEYTATATLAGEGYNTLTLTAKLTIKALSITGVTFEDLTVDFDGNEHVIRINGTLPQGVRVRYTSNTATAAGKYIATAILFGAGYETLTLTANLTINEVQYTLVDNAEQLLEATQRGGLVLLANDITLENGDFINITKDTVINGLGHTVTAVNYSNSNYRVIDLVGEDCKNVTICNLNIVAEKVVQWLRGINVRLTENLNLNLNNVSVDLADYYAFNITNGNSGLNVHADGVKFSAWGAVCNHGVNVTFDAINSEFVGTNTHTGPTNGFTTIMVSDYILYNDDAFELINLCANNTLTFTDCVIVADIALDANGDKLVTTQKIADIRSPYNNKVTFNNCTLTRAHDDDKLVYSAYDSAYIPDENRDDPVFVADTNKVIINGEDVTKNDDLVENYFDE